MLCGVVSGSLMAVGILRGRSRADESPVPVYDISRRFVESFEKKFGNLNCADLTGCNLADPIGRKMMVLGKIKEKRCGLYMEWALDELAPLLP